MAKIQRQQVRERDQKSKRMGGWEFSERKSEIQNQKVREK